MGNDKMKQPARFLGRIQAYFPRSIGNIGDVGVEAMNTGLKLHFKWSNHLSEDMSSYAAFCSGWKSVVVRL